MARYIGSVCRLCRREGMKLFLKGERCFTEKCAIEKRNYAPGQHGKGGRVKAKLQGYGLQLREKQKVKRLYGMLEDQFALTFDRASQEKGVVGEQLLAKLERRLDNVAYRLGFGSSRPQARQLVRHGHVKVNGRKVNIPSYQVEEGDVIELTARAGKNALVQQSVDAVKGRGVPKWLELDAAGMKGRVLSMPGRDDVNFPIQEQLIVE
ncbi:MAG TPA: 30S ribosomal protein S4, partial [Vicinamibacteria bacterium]|nr:30S ribosomal protein S4 [Vicinamibacteria bacterium]